MKKQLEPKALVLMYHRIAELEPDIWRLAVNPENFEEHLRLLQRKWHVVPLAELAKNLKAKKLRNKSIALTFDDGYVDNFLHAKPLLEKYKLPATFFISSGNIGNQAEFWWDELERIILHSEQLPFIFDMQLEGIHVFMNLTAEYFLTESIKANHRQWKAYVQPPPTARAMLFLKVWETLRPLPHTIQQKHISEIRDWSGQTCTTLRPLCHSMTLQQAFALVNSSLVDLGAHTVSHPDLAAHSKTVQQQEILQNKKFLEEVSTDRINLLAYPYGSYTPDTMAVAKETGFTAAFTTDSRPIKSGSEPYRLGRFLIENWTGDELDQHLKQWLKM
ncbi:polysaccharide deacetylase family protein [uncultured Pontibacter sp.]|uniref:polysaccharide deacetylase family protein n=1 Tax=uncultured Pontibacter sp. TaxID=453356 RepID=UPI0026043F01|nr:polysaccharide deacetylase family protein [uncultured Pontibacter sp.]